MPAPQYDGGSIVNLMSSLRLGLGGAASQYCALDLLEPSAVAGARNVVLLLIDGLGFDFLMRHGGLLKSKLRGRISSVFPTSTAPAITTFLTGTAPRQHAITGWFMYLRELGTVAITLPFQARWGGADFTEAGIDVAEIVGHGPLTNEITGNCVIISPRDIVNSAYSAACGGRAMRVGCRDFRSCVNAVRKTIRGAKNPTYVYAYWPLLDSLCHAFGVSSQQTLGHFAEIERLSMELMRDLSGTDTLFILTADHGLIDVAEGDVHWLEQHPQAAECLSLPLCGEPRVAYCHVRSNRAQQFERYFAEHLEPFFALHRSDDLIAQGWLGEGPSDPRLGDRMGDYVLVGKGCNVIKDSVAGESGWRCIGVHGGPSDGEMYVPLVVSEC